MFDRIRFAAALGVVCFISLFAAQAQTPVALPSTMTTLGGLAPAPATSGSACSSGSSLTTTDVYGDGCPAANGVFGAAARGGVQVDSFGNVFIADDVNSIVHVISSNTGLMTVLAGKGTTCSAKKDSAGDGCLAATQTAVNSPRGIGIDPYGNVLLAGYGDSLIHMVCRTASPLCTSAQIGYMEAVAGCSTGTSVTGTAGVGLDNKPALTLGAGTCTTSLGEVDQPRGVTADKYGNVYFADTATSRTRVVVGPITSSYFSGNNPLYAALGVYYASVTQGYAYTVVNTTGTSTSTGGTATTKGAACSVTTNSVVYSGTATDTLGDGCPLEFSSVKPSSGYTSGVAMDAAGNLIFTDPSNGLRVFFVSSAGTAGAQMAAAITTNNPAVTPQPGFVYLLAGGGATAISSTPTLGTSTTVSDTTTVKVAVSPQGNIYIGDSSKVYFFDINTGYIRTLLTASGNVAAGSFCSGSSGQTSLSAYSDGCPASKSLFTNSNGLGLSVDMQGNLYLFDASSNTTGMLVRKVLAQGLAAETLATPLTQMFETHLLGATSATSTVSHSSNGDMSYGSPSCTKNADSSVDCNVAVTVTPSQAGSRSASLTVTNASSGEELTVDVGGSVTGSVLAFDHASTTASGTTTAVAPTTNTIFSSITPASLAVDGASNVYAANGSTILESIGGTSYTLSPALTAAPSQIAVDATGNIFAVNSATSTIEELAVTSAGTPSSYTAATISYSNGSTPAPVAIAVDQSDNVYVADSATQSVYRITAASNTVQTQTTIATGFTSVVSLAVSPAGNVYVADKGAGTVLQLTPALVSGQYVYSQTTKLSSVSPIAVAVDAAGDLYVQDAASGNVVEVPASGPTSVPVLTGLGTPAGVAVDGLGNVYSADATADTVTQVVRDAAAYNFGTNESTTFAGTLTNVGNQASTGQNTSTSNTLNFIVNPGTSNGCSVSSSVVGAVASGQACTLSAALTGNGSTTVNDYISFLPSASAAGELTLTGTLLGNSYPTTTQIGTPTGTLTYSGNGTEAGFTITVAASSASTAPAGSVNVYIDSSSAYTQYALTAATSNSSTAVISLSDLHAGAHTIAVVYPTTGQYTGSGSPSTTTGFTIAQAGTSTSWTPAATTQMVSQAMGTAVLNATATTSDTTVSSVPGTFTYTYTPTGGSAASLDASTYLPIGSYSLGVTFTPIDNVDYATSTASVASYSVTQATTTAAVGASTNLVAADGTGNFTSLSAALSALPVTGGTLYLKPGTYTGQNAISYPNVQLRGLGGNAANVILTAEDGAFSSPFVYPGSGPGNANASGDQGSSTLDVTKSAYMGTTLGTTSYIPNNFYAEYLTIQNTYNTDTTTTSTYSTAGGSCANTGTAQTLAALYNSGTQCNSQALALWIESDQAILNNVNLTSQQDTLYAGSQGCGTFCTVARQYMWRGTITGDVDYVFGDAATVFDHTNFFTTWHGNSATGTETIEAQNKKYQTGSSNDYLSGYICNGCTLMSQSTGMTNLYYGRPYGPYSTWIMLNSNVDQVNPLGWIEFSGDTNLPTSTYAEFNTQPFADPTPGTYPYPATVFGSTPSPFGGNVGAGVSGTRETTSQDPGTLEDTNTIKTQLTAWEAAQYYPVQFLGSTVSASTLSAGQPATWNPVSALANAVNAFVPAGNVTLSSNTQSVTILGRPQTPGAGVIPTGTYAFYDSVTGGTCTSTGAGCMQLASGNLDASGEAYLTTNSLTTGKTHTITMVYGGDSNFAGSTSSTFTITVPSAPLIATTTALTVAKTSINYGGTISGTVTVTPVSGTVNPTGVVTLLSGTTTLGSCTLSNAAGATSSCSYSLTGVAAGAQSLTASYASNGTFAGSTSSAMAFGVARVVLQVTANNASMVAGSALPSFTYSITGFVNGDTQATAVTGTPTLSTAATGTVVGEYPIAISSGTLAAGNYLFTFTGGYLYVTSTSAAAPVATGDTRTVTEPSFPAVCAQLTANIAEVNDDIPASVDATNSNPDGARIQAALNSCSANSPGQSVELSISGAGNNAFLSGPLSMPSNVTLLVDPGVVLFFSRNAQDYDMVPGTHTCGTVNSSSATSSCQPLVAVPGTSTNVGIMGYGKLDGRGGDTLLNPIAPYGGYSWWGLSAAANGVGNQQNPRFIQMNSGSSNITLYKITVRNSPLFHISTGGAVNGFTAWDVKIVTPTSSRNTDGIDPGNAQNFTITRSWISDGDDNVAVGGAGTTAPAANISVTNNHFFAGHGESIGSFTGAGVSNVLFDGNMSAGNGFASHGSASITGTADSNSTAVRIKSANDRGGVVSNIQYSNSCFLDHKVDVQFTPYYSAGDGTTTFPNFKNILMQNLVFANDNASTGTYELTGEFNTNLGNIPSPVINPLGITLDNVTFPSAFTSLVNSTTPVEPVGAWTGSNYSGGTGQYASLIYGPGGISSNFISAYQSLVNNAANNDTVTNNITASSLNPPACTFTYIAPELTGPNGLPQSIIAGQNATAVVILTPAVGGAAYPTGSVALTDSLSGNTTTVALTGTSDTVSIPLTGLAVGTHTFTATYSGDSNYTLPAGSSVYTTVGPYDITVNSGNLASSSTALNISPATTSYGNSVSATALVTGASPTGTVQFIVNGQVYSTQAISSGSATSSFSLPYSTSAYNVSAIYSGDSANAGSTSATSAVTISQATTATMIAANTTTTSLGHPVSVTATVSAVLASAGTPTGTVTFSYSTSSGGTQISLGSVALTGGSASASVDLPQGTSYVQATYATSGSYLTSTSAPIAITVNLPTIIALSNSPIALPYTISNIAGGSGLAIPSSGNMACTGATDKYGDGCQAIAVSLTSGDDLRAVVADPFGNVYFADVSATLVRRISPSGIISNFAGKVSGTACVPTATVGCTPTLVSIGKARGVGSDAAGNIYIANYTGNQVFEVKVSTGLMYLVAGSGTTGSTGDGGPATTATLNAPRGVWGDSVGNIYIAETGGNKIRVVDTTGNIHTFAGTGTSGSIGDGTPATSATINNPQGVTTDVNLNVYIADSSNGKIRVVCVTCGTNSPLDALLGKLGISSPVNGDIYTLVGNGSSGTYAYTVPVLATSVSMAPQKLAIDNTGDLYISDSNGFIWFLDFHTGYLHAVAKSASSVCASATDAFGDGCPATQSKFGSNGGNGLGVGADTQGNIYISDSTNGLIRKVSTGLASSATAVNATLTQNVEIHFVAGDAPAASNAFSFPSTEWSLGSPACTTNGDNTTDCLLSSRFKPAVPGGRSTPLTVNTALGNQANLALTGSGLGGGATLDPANQSSFGANLSVTGLAIDNAGNAYVADSNSRNLLRFAASALSQGASAPSTTLATLTAPGPVAVDARGFVYVGDTSTGLITQVSPSGATSTLSLTLKTPSGLVTDSLNNLYIADSSAPAVYQLNPITGAVRTLGVANVVAPAGLAIDPSGNLLVTDPGVPAVYRYNLQTGATTTITTPAIRPSGIATDAAGNLLIADTASILAVPASANSSSFTVASLTPSALAADSAGNLYTGSNGGVVKLTRTQAGAQFTVTSTGPKSFTLLEAGNQTLAFSSISQTDSADFRLSATASTDCSVSSQLPSALAIGGSCALAASYSPTTNISSTDTATFNGNLFNADLSSPSSVQLTLTGPPIAPTIAFSISNATYGASPITLAATSNSTGAITYSYVSGPATVSGSTLTITGAGQVTVQASQVANGNYAAGTQNASFTVAPKQVSVSIIGNPTKQYDGTTIATLTPANYQIVGLVGSDSITVTQTVGTYASAAAGPEAVSANLIYSAVSGSLTNYVLPTTATGTGTITQPAVLLSTSKLSFGNQPLNTTSAAQTVTLTNTGTAPLTIGGIVISGTNATNFSKTTSCGGMLAVGNNCTIAVTYHPTTLVNSTATLTISDNALGLTQSVALTGTGAPATPVFSPVAGVYQANTQVTITDSTPGATIYYTVNGGSPDRYTKPITVTATETIQACALVTPGTMTAGSTYNETASIQACTILPGTAADPLAGQTYSPSAPTSATYTIVAAPVAPTILLAGGTYTGPQQVTITDATPGAGIYYTINGGAPQLYTGPVTIAATEVLKAGAFFALTNGLYATSPGVTVAYTIAP